VSRERSLSLDSVLQTTQDQVSASFGEEVVVLDMARGLYFGLDGPGQRVWALLQRPMTLRAVVDTLVSEYDVEGPACEADVRALAEDLMARGLIRTVSAPPA
jgi:hypothetical protein